MLQGTQAQVDRKREYVLPVGGGMRRPGIITAEFGRVGIAALNIGLSLLLAAHLSACAQLPDQANVKKFADATTSVAAIFTSSININADLAQREGVERDALIYLNQDSVPGNTYQLPPKPAQEISTKALASQRALIAAIGKYAQALSSASDPATIQNLQTAATSLSASIGTAAAPFAGPAVVPIVTPVSQLIGRGFGLAVENTYGPEIRDIMVATHPALRDATQHLKISFAAIINQNQNKLNLWRGAKIEVLKKIRATPGENAAAIGEFRNAVSEAQDLQSKVEVLQNYSLLLDSMVAAHAGLIARGPSSDADLANFVDLVNQVTTLISITKPKG